MFIIHAKYCAMVLTLVMGPTWAATAHATPASAAPGPYRILPPVRLWPGVPPGADAWVGRSASPVQEGLSPDGEKALNVVDPTYQAYLPPPDKATGTAVIIAPGGGFRTLWIKSGGTQIAEWLASRGIAAFVLKYRLLQNEKAEKSMALPIDAVSAPATADGIQALKLIRARAADYGINPARIGAIGFSAGGHVVSMIALNPVVADRVNFVAPIYGAPFTVKPFDLPPANLPPAAGAPKQPWLARPAIPAPGALPPFFLAMSQGDVAVGDGVRRFYDALFTAGYRPELHLYLGGGHGFTHNGQGGTSDHYLEEFYWWLEAQGLAAPAAKTPRNK